MKPASAGLVFLSTAALVFGQGGKSPQPRPPEVKSFLAEDKVAVLVGIDHYVEESGFTTLNHAEDDAADLAKALKAQHYDVHLIPESKAMRSVVTKQLRDYANTKGTLVFFFSGHGGAGLKNSAESYLATMDVDSDDIDRTGLSISEVQSILKASPAARKMMFLDACRDGAPPPSPDGSRSKAKTPPAMLRLAGSTGLRVLYSTTPGKRSYEDDVLGHGIFTKFLIDGINGEAAGPDGLVTFRTLEDFVTLKVKEYKPIQQPYEGPSDGAGGDFYIAGQPKPEAARKALVIGINTHPNAPKLQSAVKDSEGVASQLKNLGFDVTHLTNASRGEIEASIASFAKSLGLDDIAVFYYSGTGGICEGLPVVIPSDVSAGEEAQRTRGVVIDRGKAGDCRNLIPATSLAALVPEGHLGPIIAIFDMCLTRMDSKPLNPGALARDNFFYLFAAQPGENAYENENGGYFTQLLLQVIAAPGASTASLSGKIGLKLKSAQAHQYPYELNYLAEPFYFAPAL
jgi:uncharacterized caspase-like protein